MRIARLAGLGALSALVVAAMLAAPSASATTLCSVNESPCPPASTYPAGTKIEATLSTGKTLIVLNGLGNVVCTGSTLTGESTSAGGPEEVVKAKVTGLTFTGCKQGEASCTVTAVHLPYSAFFSAPENFTMEQAEGVGATAKCGFAVNCTFSTKKAQLKMTSGSPATLTATKVSLERAGAFCPAEAFLDAEYTIQQPKPLFIEVVPPPVRKFAAEEGYGLANSGAPNLAPSFTGEEVNVATGNLVESQTDIARLGGRGPALEYTRSYNSQLAAGQKEAGPLGYGWTGSYSARLAIDEKAETATVHQDNGSAVVFYLFGGKYTSGSWVEATLTKKETTYVYTLPNQLKLEFSSSGQLTKETDRHGNALTLTYNAKSQLETVADDAKRKLTFAYNAEGQIETVKDPMGHTVKYGYETGKLTTVTLPAEEATHWKFGYDASHQLTTLTDGRAHTTATEYDEKQRVKSQTDPLERKTSLEYKETSGVRETTITEPNGSKTVEKLNEAAEPTETTRASGTELAQTTKAEYNMSFALTKSTDANNHSTAYGYDSEGNRTSEKDANENEAKWGYNSTHDVTSETTPRGETTTITRNSAGDAETIKRPAPGATTQEFKFKWAANGDLEEETDPLGHVTKFEYDSFGDRKAQIDPEEDKTTWTYNEDGLRITAVSPRGNEVGAKASEFETKTERDAQGRAIKVTDPLGHETKYKYDADGNQEVLTNPNGHATTYVYDNVDERIEVKAANGNVKKTAYDSMGQVKSKTDGNNHTIKLERNALEQITEEIDPLERKTIRTYDAAGNLKEVKDGEGRTSTYTYDAGNRLKEIKYSEEVTKAVSYEYGQDGEVTAMKDGTGTTTKTYDELDRLTETKNGNAEVVKYEYNLADQITKITYPNTKSITRGFDKAGRLEKVTDWLGKETKFAYNRDSLPKTTTFPAASANKDEYEYNTADQLIKTTMLKSAETLASVAYTRDTAGQLKTATQKGLPGAEKPEYVYDEKERLTSGAGASFEYDAADSPTKVASTTYSYDAGSQLKEGGGTKYAFNKVGQRTTATPEKGPATTYGWDQAGNLISITRKAEGEVKEIKDTYAYDGAGLRASQTINGTKTQLAWDTVEDLPLLLYDGTNSYLYGPEGMPFEQIAAETATYLHHDQQGSTRLLTNSSGETKGTYTYTPYGAVEGYTGTSTTPLGYGGQYRSEDTGLIYLRARAYDPVTAQFLSVDPALLQTGEPYSYAGDSPTNRSDPNGLGFGGLCGTISIAIPAFRGSGASCVVSDGQQAVLLSSIGGSAGLNDAAIQAVGQWLTENIGALLASANAGVGIYQSDAVRVADLRGRRTTRQYSIGFGVGITVTRSTNPDTGGVSTLISAGPGFGLGNMRGASYNWAFPLP